MWVFNSLSVYSSAHPSEFDDLIAAAAYDVGRGEPK